MDQPNADHQLAAIVVTNHDPFQSFESAFPDSHPISDRHEAMWLQCGATTDAQSYRFDFPILDRHGDSATG
jgi:hypothetical protein